MLTHIEKKYPYRIAEDVVRLYGVGQIVPETAQWIGRVQVVNGGAPTKCNYEQVMALTDHRKPSLLGRSCHQIAGDMFWGGDMANWKTGTVATLSASVGDKNTTGVVKSAFRHSTFYANVGYAFITSKYLFTVGCIGQSQERYGLAIRL